MNLLLCIFNDNLDLRLIEQNRFVPKLKKFNPSDIFKSILEMFSPQVKMLNNSLKVINLSQLPDPRAFLPLFTNNKKL